MIRMLLPIMNNNNQQLQTPLPPGTQDNHSGSLRNDNVKQAQVETKTTMDVEGLHKLNSSNPASGGVKH